MIYNNKIINSKLKDIDIDKEEMVKHNVIEDTNQIIIASNKDKNK